MNMNKMIVSNLAHRPLRSIISIFAVAVEVTLILLIVGFALGTLNDSKARTKGMGADLMVRPPGSSMFAALSAAPMPIKIGDVIAQQPHVVAVAPVLVQTSSKLEILSGIDLKAFESLGGPMRYLDGGPFREPFDMIVDEYYAANEKVRVGSTVKALDHEFHVAGIVPQGRGSRAYVPITTLQNLTGAPDKATVFYVKVDDPKNAGAVAGQIKSIAGMGDYNIMTMEEWLSLMSVDHLPMLSKFIDIVIWISVVIGFLVIFQSMYTAVMERTREIGILKSLGASKVFVVRVILRETLVLAVGGIFAGIIISYVAAHAIRYKIPTAQVQFTGFWLAKAAIIAILGSIVGASYPAFKAAQKDPIDALAYE
ncbi:MAG TPA: FtsX-like permease family protein [Candidatus Angelobacter sp.]|nr:FtsX-like permease family protein [Candidatus Angelobacter sp.]